MNYFDVCDDDDDDDVCEVVCGNVDVLYCEAVYVLHYCFL